jgi:hypothetical protein
VKKILLAIAMLVSVCGMVGMAEAQVAIGTNCTISWNANTEPDLAGYRVYGTQGGVTKTLDVTKPVVSTTCVALGIGAGGPLAIQVDAVDLVGNRSVKSPASPVQAIQDIAGPGQPTGVSVVPNP